MLYNYLTSLHAELSKLAFRAEFIISVKYVALTVQIVAAVSENAQQQPTHSRCQFRVLVHTCYTTAVRDCVKVFYKALTAWSKCAPCSGGQSCQGNEESGKRNCFRNRFAWRMHNQLPGHLSRSILVFHWQRWLRAIRVLAPGFRRSLWISQWKTPLEWMCTKLCGSSHDVIYRIGFLYSQYAGAKQWVTPEQERLLAAATFLVQ